MIEKFENTIPSQEDKEKEPVVKYQLMCNSVDRKWYVNEWTQEQLNDPEVSGYKKQDGGFEEVGLYNTPEELSLAEHSLRSSLAA